MEAALRYSPLYRQIRELLLDGLRGGEWRPGARLPSELELAARYGVSQGTVRRAIADLVAENLLLRQQGKGTYVATHGEPQVRFRFLRLAPDTGEPTPPERRVLELRRARAGGELARLLELRPGDPVLSLRRLLLFGGEPVILEQVWLPGVLFRGLTVGAVAEHRGALYNLFETQYGTRVVRAEERLKAVAAEASVAAALGLPAGTPVLEVKRLTFTYRDRPVEWRHGWYRTQTHHYRSELG